MQSQKDLPIQLLISSKPLRATLVLASFGAAQAFSNHVFDLALSLDASKPIPAYEKPLRYGKLPEINHIFRADPQSGPKIFSLAFAIAVLATVPVLLGAVRIPCMSFTSPSTNTSSTVGLPWSQYFSSLEGYVCRTNLACPLLWLDYCHGRHLLSILLELEFIPDSPCGRCCWINRILEWKQSPVRSAEPKIGRREIGLPFRQKVQKFGGFLGLKIEHVIYEKRRIIPKRYYKKGLQDGQCSAKNSRPEKNTQIIMLLS